MRSSKRLRLIARARDLLDSRIASGMSAFTRALVVDGLLRLCCRMTASILAGLMHSWPWEGHCWVLVRFLKVLVYYSLLPLSSFKIRTESRS